MNLIAEVEEKDVFINGKFRLKKYERLRRAARALLFNESGDIALIYIPLLSLYKLPGGEIKSKEKIEASLRRNILEETGYSIKKIIPLGRILEFKNKYLQLQTSYYFICHSSGISEAISRKNENGQTEFSLIWMNLDTAIETMNKSLPVEYTPQFIRKRDIAALTEAKILLSKLNCF
ncbi:NUDIX domain-containing protein [Candidatus Pacearchaeota archaeon]|nr:NUDIX domain-containing protein [Candidatus Pacearchaeota archaeon]